MPRHNLLAKALPQVQLGSINQTLLDLEVDLVVLSKEVSKLDAFCGEIGACCRDLRLSLQEQELVQEAQDLI